MEDLNQLSDAVQVEMNLPFVEINKWRTQKPDRYFEWVLHRTDQTVSPSDSIYHTALVVFHDGEIELYKGSSPIEIFAKKTALRLALRDLKINSKEEEGEELDSGPDTVFTDFDSVSGSRPVPAYVDSDHATPIPKENFPGQKVLDKTKCVDKVYELNSIAASSGSEERNRVMKRWFDGSQFSGETPLKAAEKFFEELCGAAPGRGTFTFSLVLKKEKERKFSFRSAIGETSTVSPCAEWDKKKKMYTDGAFVYTVLEKAYAVLLENGALRPLTKLEMDDLSDRGIQYLNASNMKEIYNLQRQQYDSDTSSSEDSSDEKHYGSEIDMEKKIPKPKETSGGEKWNQGDVQWDEKCKLCAGDKFVFDGNKKVFGKLDYVI